MKAICTTVLSGGTRRVKVQPPWQGQYFHWSGCRWPRHQAYAWYWWEQQERVG